jgi:hypothetical protein
MCVCELAHVCVVYTCVCALARVCVRMCTRARVCMRVCARVCASVYTCACVRLCTRARVRVTVLTIGHISHEYVLHVQWASVPICRDPRHQVPGHGPLGGDVWRDGRGIHVMLGGFAQRVPLITLPGDIDVITQVRAVRVSS